MSHSYDWSTSSEADGTVHSSAGPCGLVCVVDVVPGAYVAWSVRVGDANGLRVGGGTLAPKEMAPGEWADWASVAEPAKRRAQEHADDVAAVIAGHAEAERARADAHKSDADIAWEALGGRGAYASLADGICDVVRQRDKAASRQSALAAALEAIVAWHSPGAERVDVRIARDALAAHAREPVPRASGYRERVQDDQVVRRFCAAVRDNRLPDGAWDTAYWARDLLSHMVRDVMTVREERSQWSVQLAAAIDQHASALAIEACALFGIEPDHPEAGAAGEVKS